MLSIIICSISPERLQEISQNIHATIGVEHEIIVGSEMCIRDRL